MKNNIKFYTQDKYLKEYLIMKINIKRQRIKLLNL